MSESLEARAARVADALAEAAELKTRRDGGYGEVRDRDADALAELAEIVRALVAEVSAQ